MQIKFLGAAQTVTGSMHLLNTAGGRVLVDCGMVQGRREESRAKNANLPPEVASADTLILTHAHIDHSGSIPTLVKNGYRGSIYTTPATRDLCAYMLRDSARIQEADAEYLNRKFGDEPDWKTIVPLYTEEDAIEALKLFVAVPYARPFTPVPGVTARLIDAGHILGSAEVLVEAEGRRIVFSGDLGRNCMPITRDPEIPPAPVDYLLMESTYGNRVHADIRSMNDDLERVVKATLARGGKLIVPSFAVGRTQELLYALSFLSKAGRLPDVPIFIDSPLSVNITEVFKLHPEVFDAETRQFIEDGGDLFGFRGLHYISKVEDSMKLNTMREPAIIIASSGMCEAGRILHHLRNNCEDPKNTILIVGFQAQHTLGRRIVERRPRIRVLGVERDLRAQVEVMNAFSAHADKNDLLAYARASATGGKCVYLVHGEDDQQEPLAAEVRKAGLRCEVPRAGQEETLG